MEPRIAELLVRGGIINREQLNESLDRQKKNGSNLAQELVRLGHTTEEKLSDFFAKQFGIEKVELENDQIPDAVF
ncbi:MAG: type II secretion system protein GspE, partial [Candidatus Binatia bacterium]